MKNNAAYICTAYERSMRMCMRRSLMPPYELPAHS